MFPLRLLHSTVPKVPSLLSPLSSPLHVSLSRASFRMETSGSFISLLFSIFNRAFLGVSSTFLPGPWGMLLTEAIYRWDDKTTISVLGRRLGTYASRNADRRQLCFLNDRTILLVCVSRCQSSPMKGAVIPGLSLPSSTVTNMQLVHTQYTDLT